MPTHLFDLTNLDLPAEMLSSAEDAASWGEAESILLNLAAAFPLVNSTVPADARSIQESKPGDLPLPEIDARYRTLVEQIPAVVFMAYLDKGIGEAYVSPQIEAMLGFTQEEWLNDPVRWYQQIHPEDKARWSLEAAGLFMSGQPLKSLYRVLARDGHVVWFHCEAKMVRNDEGSRGLFTGSLLIFPNSSARKLRAGSIQSVLNLSRGG